jgi:hypothetical protein
MDMADQILPGFEPEITNYIENHLASHGIMTFTKTKLEAILGNEKVEKVKTNKRAMKTDAVIVSIGIRPNTAFLADTGIQLSSNKAIIVNEYMETNIKDIYLLTLLIIEGNNASVLTSLMSWSIATFDVSAPISWLIMVISETPPGTDEKREVERSRGDSAYISNPTTIFIMNIPLIKTIAGLITCLSWIILHLFIPTPINAPDII